MVTNGYYLTIEIYKFQSFKRVTVSKATRMSFTTLFLKNFKINSLLYNVIKILIACILDSFQTTITSLNCSHNT